MQTRNWIRGIGTMLGRRRRAVALAAALLLAGPVVTGDGEAVLLNAAGLAWTGLLVLRFTGGRAGSRAGRRRAAAVPRKQTAQQTQGGER